MKTKITTQKAPAALPVYSQGIIAQSSSFIFVAGQLGVDPQTGEFVDGIEGQTRQVLQNLEAILKAGGSDMSKVVKTTVFLHDISDFAAMNSVYEQFFPEPRPARSAIQAGKLPKEGALVEIEAIAIQ